MFGTDRATLGPLTIVTRTWGDGTYQADLLIEGEGRTGTPLVALNHQAPEELRTFARALLAVADETATQYGEG